MSVITSVLAANIEIWKREQCCVLVNRRRAGFEILHPSEAYVLSLLDGNIEERELENIIRAVYGISPENAAGLVRDVLGNYSSCLVDSRENTFKINRYEPEDFLYRGFEKAGDLSRLLSGPLLLTMDLTGRCNFRCQYCYYGKHLSRGKDMPVDMALKIIDDAADAGVVQISFGGGESMLYPGFSEIVRAVKNRHMLLSFTTNGSLLNKDTVPDLVEKGLESIGISIDSPDPAMHHLLTRSVNTFDKVISGIRELKAKGVWVRTVSVMTGHNIQAASGLIDLLIDLGADAVNICPYSERSYEGNKRCFEGSLSEEEKQRLALLVKEKSLQYRERIIFFDTRENIWEDPQNIRPCTHIFWGFVVHWDGNVFPCELIDDKELCFGNLFKSNIKDIWHGDKRKRFIQNTVNASIVDSECAQCQLLSKCHTGCFNLAKVASGSYFAKDPRCPGRKQICRSLHE
jgi:pyrroloquinoline quinone biosynthesis protein E